MISPNTHKTETIIIKPQLTGFLLTYIFFSLPGFIISVLGIFLVFMLISVLSLGLASIGSLSNETTTISKQLPNLVSINDSQSSKGVLIYDLEGPITSDNVSAYNSLSGIFIDKVKQDFEIIKRDSRIKNVIFRINTPGGEVYASEVLGDLINDLISNFKLKNQEALFYFEQIVASGGLWSTYKTKNNYVIASPYGKAGSIGVLISLPNLEGLAQKVGFEEIVFKSSQEKDLGNPFRELSQTERDFFTNEIETTFQQFKRIIKDGRKLNDQQVDKIANGLVTPNPDLVSLGLVDEVGDLQIAIDKANQNANLSDSDNVWETKPKEQLFASFFESLSSNIPGYQLSKRVDNRFSLKSGISYVIDERYL